MLVFFLDHRFWARFRCHVNLRAHDVKEGARSVPPSVDDERRYTSRDVTGGGKKPQQQRCEQVELLRRSLSASSRVRHERHTRLLSSRVSP